MPTNCLCGFYTIGSIVPSFLVKNNSETKQKNKKLQKVIKKLLTQQGEFLYTYNQEMFGFDECSQNRKRGKQV